jgi:hydrogenase maturation protease
MSSGERQVLVVGYGNDLRGDDALGPRVAEAVAECSWPQVEAVAVRQLLPELAERVARCAHVIFADADPDAFRVALEPLPAGSGGCTLGHALGPAELLELVQQCYAAKPQGWLLRLPGRDFAFGRSPASRHTPVVAEAVRLVADFVSRLPALASPRAGAKQS